MRSKCPNSTVLVTVSINASLLKTKVALTKGGRLLEEATGLPYGTITYEHIRESTHASTEIIQKNKTT
eukprot:6468178-Amphidinium_carterae.1